MRVTQTTQADIPTVAALAALLWPEHTADELAVDIVRDIEGGNQAYFISWEEDTAVGFAQCALRRDYVQGSSTSPVGYLEGIYVRDAYRNQGVGRQLARACEHWAARRGCTEFASDVELSNKISLRFHERLGFAIANTVVCLVKKID